MLLLLVLLTLAVIVSPVPLLQNAKGPISDISATGWYVPQIDGTLAWLNADRAASLLQQAEAEQTAAAFRGSKPLVRYFLYTRQNPVKPIEIKLGSDNINTIKESTFNPEQPTRMIIHGWTQSHETEMNTHIRDAWLGRENCNIIVVDWEKARSRSYITSLVAITKTGHELAKMIHQLKVLHGLELANLHLIGHSLGAHVAGIAGKAIPGIRTIVGLDPASPLVSFANENKRLASNDAHYVETIHTNGGLLGFLQPLGKAAFYPNGGKKQPGCDDLTGLCSHKRSTAYYAEAVAKNNYLTRKCPHFQAAIKDSCDSEFSGVRMASIDNHLMANGTYYVPVRSSSPFGFDDFRLS